MPRRIDRARRRQWHHRKPSCIETARSSEHSDGGADMLTMALLAIVAAVVFGFVLCGMFVLGAAADLDTRPKDIALLHPGQHGGAARSLETQRPDLAELRRRQASARPR